MKNKILLLTCCFSLVACAQRMDDDSAGDDDGHHQPDPDPDPDAVPVACDSDDDCVDYVDCNRGVCLIDRCAYVSECAGDDVCNVETDACEQPPHPTTHGISCFETGGTLYLTISGQLTDAVYGGSLSAPRFISVASDQIEGSWNVNAATAAPKVVLSAAERTSGYVTSASINLPSNQAQRFTLMVWSDDSGGYARRFDLGDWTVSGDGCARIDDGAADGVTDGYVIGRAPLCPSACDDGNASTADVCSSTGCIHDGTVTTPGNGTISCAESGNYVNVTISGGILAHLFSTVTPSASWKIVYGSNPGSWQVPYAAGSTKDSESWSTDGASYLLQLPNDVTLFNFALTDGSNQYWFDLNEFNASGSTCAHVTDGGGITRTATSVSAYGTLTCEMTSETGSLKRKVTITPNVGRDIRDALSESPAPLPSPSVIQYGGSDGWTLPYLTGSPKPQLSWSSGTVAYTFYLDPAVDDFNFFVVDNDDPSDSWSGGDFFDLDRWSVTNVGSAGCHRVGGGVSIN
ncbi:MAG: hypothetical protein AAB554_01080 [Patescibacteria group bacterium]